MRPGTFHSCWLAIAMLTVSTAAAADWEPAEIVGLVYPWLAKSARVAGVVVVRLSVAPDGSVKQATAVSGHPLLAEAARQNAGRWKFTRSEQDRGADRDAYLVYRFVLEGNCAGRDCRTGFVVELPNLVMVTSEIPSIQVSQGKQP
jgi:TonB family protein